MTQQYLDNKLVLPCLCMVAVAYGLARYTYGLFIPVFRSEFGLSDQALAYIAAVSYASYFVVTLLGIYISSRVDPKQSLIFGGVCAVVGMLLIAVAPSTLWLALGVMVAGVSAGLAYTPLSAIIAQLVSEAKQRHIYAIINSGTSLGVILGGPAAILLQAQWRYAWLFFAVFALLTTLWCYRIIPPVPLQQTGNAVNFRQVPQALRQVERIQVLLVAFVIGISTSVYWTFSVDLIASRQDADVVLFGKVISSTLLSQLFWIVVGVSGFGGIFAGKMVSRLGVKRAMCLFLVAIGAALLVLAWWENMPTVTLSALLFGCAFVLMAAALGMWSLEVFTDMPAVGFGLVFLLLSVGQFVGPILTGVLLKSMPLSTIFLIAGVATLLINGLLIGRRRYRISGNH